MRSLNKPGFRKGECDSQSHDLLVVGRGPCPLCREHYGKFCVLWSPALGRDRSGPCPLRCLEFSTWVCSGTFSRREIPAKTFFRRKMIRCEKNAVRERFYARENVIWFVITHLRPDLDFLERLCFCDGACDLRDAHMQAYSLQEVTGCDRPPKTGKQYLV